MGHVAGQQRRRYAIVARRGEGGRDEAYRIRDPRMARESSSPPVGPREHGSAHGVLRPRRRAYDSDRQAGVGDGHAVSAEGRTAPSLGCRRPDTGQHT